jgi:hypothetical protein
MLVPMPPDAEPFMTTPRDLLIVAMDMDSSRPVERGDLSLALAGAELVDLLGSRSIRLDDDRLVPEPHRPMDDRLLDEAASSLAREEPYESVGDWLWRRGRGLFAAYLAALESEGRLVRQRPHRWMPFGAARRVLVDSPARRSAANRWKCDEPVLASLAVTVGIRDKRTPDSPSITDHAVWTVLTAVDDAVVELSAERRRRARRLDEAAADNVRRGY